MSGLRTHRVTKGDSLQKLARYYNIEDWREISLINSLKSPYIDGEFPPTTDYGEGVAKVGDIILIPSFETYNLKDKQDREQIESAAYGKDLSIYDSRVQEHRIKGNTNIYGNDLQTVQGLDNLAQQLKTRLSIRKGALLLHPDFGSEIHLYTGKLDTVENRNKILWEVESCIRSDFRIKDILDIEVKFNDGVTYVQAKIVPIEPRQPFEFIYHLEGVENGI